MSQEQKKLNRKNIQFFKRKWEKRTKNRCDKQKINSKIIY